MSEVATGIVELGQGALTARALEPEHGEAGDGHTHESVCLNCGTKLIGGYCHACGQHAHIHRTLGAFFHDLAHGVFHVEGKIWRTLPALVLKPGQLTRDYIDGKRASYLSPIALFLFSVFLLFAVLHLIEDPNQHASLYTSVGQASADQQAKLDQLVRKRAQVTNPDDQKELEKRIAKTREEVESLKHVQSMDIGKIINVNVRGATDSEIHSDFPMLDRGIKAFRENPDLAFYKLQMTAYKYSWLLIPISVPMLWLLFPFSRRFKLYDHTVFVTYSLAFMTLLALIAALCGLLGDTIGFDFAAILWLIPPIHMYRQLRGTYLLSRKGALWRTVALVVFACSALVVFASALVSVELAG